MEGLRNLEMDSTDFDSSDTRVSMSRAMDLSRVRSAMADFVLGACRTKFKKKNV